MSICPTRALASCCATKAIIVLGLRRKKAADAAKDPTPELEYMGGKVEDADLNDPLRTAYAELAEELGALVLDADTWRQRVKPLHIFQPFSKKWIWCLLYDLNDAEFARVREAARDIALGSYKWDVEQPYASWTGRPLTPIRKSLDGIFLCSATSMNAYITGFTRNVPASKNRLTDAKAYREQAKLRAVNIATSDVIELPLCAFNTVLWEQHVERIIH